MKHWMLEKLVIIFKGYKKISSIYRIEDNLFKCCFENDLFWFFDLSKQHSLIYPKQNFIEKKRYNSPFDNLLTKITFGSTIVDVKLLNNDKLLAFSLEKKGKYKKDLFKLIFELTGKHTNVVLLDEKNIVLNALHLVDSSVSSRFINISKPYTLPPLPNFIPKKEEFDGDLGKYLFNEHEKIEHQHLENKKLVRLKEIDKKIDKLKKEKDRLKDPKEMEKISLDLFKKANIILINIDKIKPYEKKKVLDNGEGGEILIEFPEAKSSSQMAQILFKNAKRAKNIAKNSHIEIENINERLEFLDFFKQNILYSKDLSELELLFSEKKERLKNEKSTNIQNFRIKNYLILLGKNRKGNEELLKKAKASDMWIHLKDRPSCHVIIRTDKQNLPSEIIYEASKLCANFTLLQKGVYLVDYTQRRFVKSSQGANVLYTNYKTISVDTA